MGDVVGDQIDDEQAVVGQRHECRWGVDAAQISNAKRRLNAIVYANDLSRLAGGHREAIAHQQVAVRGECQAAGTGEAGGRIG